LIRSSSSQSVGAVPVATRARLAQYRRLVSAWHIARGCAFSILARASPELLGRLRFRAAWGRWPDFENPTTFDEKLLWLNLYWRHPLKTECADKYAVRGYADRLGLGALLPRLYGVYDSAQAIDFGSLPERYVLKCSHGCKCNLFCLGENGVDVAVARRSLERWLRTDYSHMLGELHYRNMKPRIICEEYLDEGNGRLPTDYKVFCFGGRPTWILCYSGRDPNGKGQRSLVDIDWQPSAVLRSPDAQAPPPRLRTLPEILTAAEVLASPFPFVRIDFYSIGKRVVLGELTFTPNGCINVDYDQLEMGGRLLLPPPYPGHGASA